MTPPPADAAEAARAGLLAAGPVLFFDDH